MKQFQPFSFILGIASGLIVLTLYAGATILFGNADFAPSGGFRQTQGQGQAFGRNRAGMAERLGMSEDELQQELDSGKTVQEIMNERGIDLPARSGTGVRMGRDMWREEAIDGSTASGSSSSLL